MADVWRIEGPTEYANAATFVHGQILSPFLMGGAHHPMLASRDQEQAYIAGSAQDPHTPAMTLVTRPFANHQVTGIFSPNGGNSASYQGPVLDPLNAVC